MASAQARGTDRELPLGWLAYGGILIVGAALYVVCRNLPAELPAVLPWEFSWPDYLATVLALGWYFSGRAQMAPAQRPGVFRSLSFVLGIVAMYAVVQSRIDYYAQHAFFVHRFQHLVLHHLGPFLIALAWPGESIWAGMPGFLKPVLRSRAVRLIVDTIQHPAVAPTLFVGLIYFWLIPSVHLYVMLDKPLYDVMNWSMAVDGLFFWALVLDPNPRPPAHAGIGVRAALTIVVVPPQIAVGAWLALSSTDYYPVYQICGRVLPVAPLVDQNYGGLILWIPAAMMSIVGLILVLNNMRKIEERNEHAH